MIHCSACVGLQLYLSQRILETNRISQKKLVQSFLFTLEAESQGGRGLLSKAAEDRIRRPFSRLVPLRGIRSHVAPEAVGVFLLATLHRVPQGYGVDGYSNAFRVTSASPIRYSGPTLLKRAGSIELAYQIYVFGFNVPYF